MIQGDGQLHIYMVNVGQGDTTLIITPEGKVILIDVMRPNKIIRLLSDLGHNKGDEIAQLIITHPHSDHFSGGNRIAIEYKIAQAVVAPFWHTFGMGPPTYQRLIGRLYDNQTNVNFLSGYSRWYPDGIMIDNPDSNYPEVDPNVPYIEMLGPTNGLIRMLEDANVFNANHLSIMTRISWRNFRMIIGADAQMENWAFFDQERMLESNCNIFRTSHHGSSNGTQWERLHRLNAGLVVVSSDPFSGHRLPDLSGVAAFLRYNNSASRLAVITIHSGTIRIQVPSSGSRIRRQFFGDQPTEFLNLNTGKTLNSQNNPTDWNVLINHRVEEL